MQEPPLGGPLGGPLGVVTTPPLCGDRTYFLKSSSNHCYLVILVDVSG